MLPQGTVAVMSAWVSLAVSASQPSRSRLDSRDNLPCGCLTFHKCRTTGAMRAIYGAGGRGAEAPPIAICPAAIATTGSFSIDRRPGRSRQRIWAGSTASASFGQRVNSACSAHMPSMRAS